MTRPIIILLSTLFVLTAGSTLRAQDADEVYSDILRDSVVFAQTNRWRIGADHLTNKIAMLEAEKDLPALDLGFLFVLKSIFLERSDDAAAYAAWTRALDLFLNNGSTWTQYRNALAADIENANYQLSSSFSGADITASGFAQKTLILKSINSLVSFTAYEGPRPGLTKRNDEEEGVLTIARSYFPRPFADPSQPNGVENRSRIGGAGDDDPVENQTAGIERGFAPAEETEVDDYTGAVSFDELEESVGQNVIRIESSEQASDAGAGAPLPPAPRAHPTTAVSAEPLDSVSTTGEDGAQAPALARRLHISGRSLTEEDKEIARRAWRYFESNRQSNTGLFNSVHNYHYTTMWDLGSSLAALYSAHQLSIVDDVTFEEYLSLLLSTLKDMPLYDGVLPNREYDTRTGLMTNLKNVIDDKGSGFSALDIGRTLTWLAIIRETHDQFSPMIEEVIEGWRLTRATGNGELFRELLISSGADRKQEGRFGYEQYAALAFLYWGVELPNAFASDELAETLVEGIPVYIDTRNPDFMNLEPFLMILMEYSLYPDVINTQLDAMIAAHIRRAEAISDIILFTEDSIDREPWFLYNVIADKEGHWSCKTSRNTLADYCQTLSAKAAFAANAIFDLDYLQSAQSAVEGNFSPRYGYYAGVYQDGAVNKALTANTNALILQSVLFKKRGTAFLDTDYDAQQARSRSRLAN